MVEIFEEYKKLRGFPKIKELLLELLPTEEEEYICLDHSNNEEKYWNFMRDNYD
jgi:hypothetical protein